MIFLILTFLVLLSAKQINKNRLQLAEMQECVGKVEAFRSQNHRLPTKEEFHGILAGLARHNVSLGEFELSSTPQDCPIQVPGGWPNASGWVMYYWRGEWYEYYTSWNNRYTLTEQASWWGFCGPMLFSPLAAVLFIGSSFLPALRRKKARTENPSPLVVQLPTSD